MIGNDLRASHTLVHVKDEPDCPKNMYIDGRVNIGGVPFTAAADRQEAVRSIVSLAASETPGGIHVHLANAYTIALASRDPQYRSVFLDDCVVFADGKPITWVSALRRHVPRLKQVPGPWLFEEVMRQGRAHELRHFLLGSTPEVLEKLETNLDARAPGVRVVGRFSPPFRPLDQHEKELQSVEIAKARADIVWVGLGTPKQDLEARRIAQEHSSIVIAVGAAFDFSAGTLKRAPQWMTSLGLEWLFRFMMEPRRLWRRYIFGNVRFLYAVLAEKR